MNEATGKEQLPARVDASTGDASIEGPVEGQAAEALAAPAPADWAPNPKFTLRDERLTGSARCLNCGTPLEGPYCHYCGQPDRNFMRFFPALLREFLAEFLELDSRFTRTMVPLLFRPGRLTRDFLDGRRFRYTPPLRLYLFSSIIFFLLAAFISSDALQDNISFGRSGAPVQITTSSEEDLERVRDALGSLPPELRGRVELGLQESGALEAPGGEAGEDAASAPEPGAEAQAGAVDDPAAETARASDARDSEDPLQGMDLQFNDRPWHPVDNPVVIGWLPQSFNDWVNEEIGRSPEKGKRIEQDPRLIINEVFDILPVTMFVLLPVVALILKFWYLFSRRYYVEHLILALHNHSFVFVSLIMLLLLSALETWATTRGMNAVGQLAFWTSTALWVWLPVYMVWSLRTVYRQNWFLTVAKGFLIALCYFTLLTFVTTVVAIVSFILV